MDPKILVKHTRIEIDNYEGGDAPRLEYLFSVRDPIRHEYKIKALEYNPVTKKLLVPRGMDIGMLRNMFMVEPKVDTKPDPYVDGEPIPIKYLARDERQLEILKFILGEDKYFYTKTKSQVAVNSTTGSGKTFVTVATMCVTGCRTIIITSSTNWLNQWKEKILEYTSLSIKDLFMIIGKDSLNKLFNRDPLQYQVFLASHSTIKSYGDSKGWDKVEELFKYLQCSFKVYDEAHLYFDNMVAIDYHSNTKKTLYLTATPLRSDDSEDIIYQEYFRNVPSIELFDENTDPHVNYLGILFNSNPTPYEVRNYSKGQFNFDRNIYTDYLVNKPNFIKIVDVILGITLPINGKVLIYIGKNEAILNVYNYLVNQYDFLRGHIGIFTSITTKEEKKTAWDNKYILSTTKSCGAASDIPNLACTVVLAEPFKSRVLARQTLGRCRADNTLYIDCVDMSCYRTRQYYKKKQDTFLKYAKSCKEMYLDDNELDFRSQTIRDKFSTKKLMTMPVFSKGGK